MPTQTVRPCSAIAPEHTWDAASVFPSAAAWTAEIERIAEQLPGLLRFRGQLGNSPATLADWFAAVERVKSSMDKVSLYAAMFHTVDTADATAMAMYDRARALDARVAAAISFEEPELLAIGFDTLRRWVREEPRLATYAHKLDRLERRKDHVRSAEVE